MSLPDKILVIEDEMIIALFTQKKLEEYGCKDVKVALNGDEGVSIAKEFKPDIILLDINLGSDSMDGIEVAKIITEQLGIPFIYVTSYTNDEIVEKVKMTNPYGFVTKPIFYSQLVACVEIALHRHRMEAKLEEERIRSEKMKMIAECSPNLIVRLSMTGKIQYINQNISRVTGKNSDHYFEKDIYNSDLDSTIINVFEGLLEKVKTKKRKIFTEATINTFMGERYMEITAVPEFNVARNVVALLFILNDITDQKIILEDVQNKNRKVTDSINYSKQIQNAILPDVEQFKQYFGDLFVLNRPKDVVSGDFPWFYKSGKYCYLACVDCTGHGVPGALMSLIIHFLLNNITKVKGAEEASPSYILDVLHLQLQRTLKQHYHHSESRDGADIALCRINLDSQELEYAGAHRPLIHISNDQLNIHKGDRLSIGGDGKRRKGRFSNTKINLQEGDIVSFFSDGVTDQFGGGEDERKFGGQRVRDLLVSHKHLPLEELSSQLNTELESWKAHRNQTDDILVIGVKI